MNHWWCPRILLENFSRLAFRALALYQSHVFIVEGLDIKVLKQFYLPTYILHSYFREDQMERNNILINPQSSTALIDKYSACSTKQIIQQ